MHLDDKKNFNRLKLIFEACERSAAKVSCSVRLCARGSIIRPVLILKRKYLSLELCLRESLIKFSFAIQSAVQYPSNNGAGVPAFTR